MSSATDRIDPIQSIQPIEPMNKSKLNLAIMVSLGLVSLGLSITSIFLPGWRVGEGSRYLYGSDDPMKNHGFTERTYGLMNIVGVRAQSWGVLSSNACDRWQLYNATNTLFEIAPPCELSLNAAACSSDFNTHLEARCNIYSYMTVATWITTVCICLAQIFNICSILALLMTPFATWRRYLATSVSLAAIFAVFSTVSWVVLTNFWFRKLGESASYPFPRIGLGCIFALTSAVVLLATAIYCMMLSSSIKKGDPVYKKRGLLHDLFKSNISDDKTTEPGEYAEESGEPFEEDEDEEQEEGMLSSLLKSITGGSLSGGSKPISEAPGTPQVGVAGTSPNV